MVSVTRGRTTGTPEQVGLDLHEQVARRGAAVDAQLASARCPQSAAIASISSALWKAMRLERRAREVRARGAARDARRCVPRACGSQYGAPRPDERGHEVHAARCRARSPRAPRCPAARAMMPRPSRSHWIAAPGDEDAALERVGGRARRAATRPW